MVWLSSLEQASFLAIPFPLLFGLVAGVECHRARVVAGCIWFAKYTEPVCLLALGRHLVKGRGQDVVQGVWFSVVRCLVGKGGESGDVRGLINLVTEFSCVLCVKLWTPFKKPTFPLNASF